MLQRSERRWRGKVSVNGGMLGQVRTSLQRLDQSRDERKELDVLEEALSRSAPASEFGASPGYVS